MYDLLNSRNEWNAKRAIDLAAKLIRVASPSLSEGSVARVAAEEMKELGYDKVVQDTAGNAVGVLFGRSDGPTVLLNSHMDTVDCNQDQWTCNPYGGETHKGRLYGLGAADCKGGLAAHIHAGSLLKRSLLPLRGNLIVAATVAEENGRSLGVRALLEQTLADLELQPDYAILGEPTGLGLYYGHDGWMDVTILVHGIIPFHVDVAAERITRGLGNGRTTSDRYAWVAREPRYYDRPSGHEACIQAERRLAASDSAREVMGQLQHEAELVVNGSGSVAVEVAVCEESQKLYTGKTVAVRQLVNAWATDPFSPLVERARQALAAGQCCAQPGKWELGRSGMGTAGGVMVKEFDLPTIGYGPGDEAQAHAVDEYVDTGKLAQAVYGTAVIVHGLIGVPVFGWTSDEI